MAWYDFLTGGATASTNPSSYQVPGAHQGQIEGMVNRGVGRVENRAAPQLAGGPQDQWRRMQMQQAQQLQNVAGGQTKGAGELAAERQALNAQAANQALASMRGAGGAGLQTAARQSAAIGSTAAGMGRQAALQDQQAAQGMLAGLSSGARGQDIGLANSNANLQQQQYQINDAAYQNFINSLAGMDANQIQAQVAAMQAATQRQGLLGPLLSVGGQAAGMAMASDERLKTEISSSAADIDAMLDALRPYKYRYKDEAKWGAGPRHGIMAQDLEKSEAGRAAVIDTAEGKLVDVNRALSAALAGAARLNERLRTIEDRDNRQDVRLPDAAAMPVARVIIREAR